MKHMKKLVALILAIVLMVGMVPVRAQAAQANYGDADSNGLVNAKDAMLVLQYYTKKIQADQLAADLCDVDGNGSINAKDAMLILQLYTKKLDKFPIDKDTAQELCVVEFDLNYPDAEQIPGKQTLISGEYAAQPDMPVREDHIFLGWYTQPEPEDLSHAFAFADTPITEDLTLYAAWLDTTQNSDEDALPDETERRIGTDPQKADTDGDGFNDDREAIYLNTDPRVAEDHNAIDSDGDGLSNAEEVRLGSDPCRSDTDGDGLTDSQELSYGTSCTKADTDGDGASDGTEVEYGTDPLTAQTSFTDHASTGDVSGQNPVSAAVSAEVPGAALGSVQVRALDLVETPLLSSSIPGYLGYAYDFTAAEAIDHATLTFTYDASLAEGNESFDPRIYYFDSENQLLTALPNQKAENGTVTAETDHFSVYVLMDESQREADAFPEDLWSELIRTAANTDTTDENGDKIPDKYNIYIFLGMIRPKTGAASFAGYDFGENADLDGDGLLNGEEVKIELIGGVPYLAVTSMPMYLDSDFDGIDDKTEIAESTDPLQYDYHGVSVDGLIKRDIYGASLYYDEVHESFMEDLANWVLTTAGSLDHGTLEKVFKDEWLAYIQNYCTDAYETTNKQSYQSYVYAENGKLLMDTLDASILKLCTQIGELGAEVVLNTSAKELESINAGIKILRGLRSSLLDEYFPGLIEGYENLSMKVPEKLLDTAKKVETLTDEIEGLSGIKDKLKLNPAMTSILEDSGFLLDVSFSAIKEYQQLSQAIDTLAYVSTNSRAYRELADVFYYVSISSEISAARDAASDLQALLTEQEALEKERAKEIAAACMNLLVDKAADVIVDKLVAKVHPAWVFVAEQVAAMGSQVGYMENAIFAASILADATAVLAQASVWGTKSYHPSESKELVDSYLTHLTQIRLLGEMKYHYMFHTKNGEAERYQNILDKLQTYAGHLNLPISKRLLAEAQVKKVPNVSVELMVFDDPAAEGEAAVYYDAGALIYLNGVRIEESNAQIGTALGRAQRFYLQPGASYTMEARGETGYTVCTQSIQTTEGENEILTFAVFSPKFADRKFLVKGKIVDDKTEAVVAGANLCFRPGHGTQTGEGVSAVTDAEGCAEVKLTAGCYTVEISHQDCTTEYRELHVYEDAQKVTFTEGIKKKPGKIIASSTADEFDRGIIWNLTDTGVLTVEGTVTIDCMKIWYMEYGSDIKSIVIGPDVTNFGVYYSIAEWIDVPVIGSTIRAVPYGPKCLESIYVHPDNPVYHSDGNCLIETNDKRLVLGSANSQIPDDGSVTSIGGAAFAQRVNLTEIVIPETVDQIGKEAFYGCKKLQSVTMPSYLKWWEGNAFEGCNALKSLEIPEGVTSLTGLGPKKWEILILPSSLQYMAWQVTDYYENYRGWTDIYYRGTRAQWKAIRFSGMEDVFSRVKIHYNYQG